MLQDFVETHRGEIINRCRGRVAQRSRLPVSTATIDHGVPMFLDGLIDELRVGPSPTPGVADAAAEHGHDRLLQGCTPSQIVHDYGDVSQTITEMAIEQDANISADDFRTLSTCLGAATAAAMTRYTDDREWLASAMAPRQGERLRRLVEGLRLAILTADVTLGTMNNGRAAVAGSTAALLGRSLTVALALVDSVRAEIEGPVDRPPQS